MARASDGTYSLVAGNPVVSGAAISSTWANNTMSDIATALTGSLSRSGQGPMLAALELYSGTSSTPGLSFDSESNSGWYYAGATDLRMVIAATELLQYTTNLMRMSGTAPAFRLNETDAAANNRLWDIIATGEDLKFQALTDALAATTFLTIARTAGVIDSITLAATLIAVSGNATVSGTLAVTGVTSLAAGSTVAGNSLTDTAHVTSGTWASARISQASVTQHQAALSIAASQLTGTVSASIIDAAIARLASPTFTGTPAAPTAAAGTQTTQLATTAFCSPGYSHGTSGYDKLPSGLVLQWGSFAVGDTNQAATGVVNFPTAFSSACYSVVISVEDRNSGYSWFVALTGVSTTQFAYILGETANYTQDGYIHWHAIGK